MVLNYGLYDSNTSKFLLPIITVIRNCFEHLEYLTLLGLGWGASRLVASIILMQLFVDLSNWFKVSWLFLKLTLKNFVKNFFSFFSQLLLTSSFFNKGSSCVIENSIYFDAMVKMVYFSGYVSILYCKIIISLFVYFADPVNKKKHINS